MTEKSASRRLAKASVTSIMANIYTHRHCGIAKNSQFSSNCALKLSRKKEGLFCPPDALTPLSKRQRGGEKRMEVERRSSCFVRPPLPLSVWLKLMGHGRQRQDAGAVLSGFPRVLGGGPGRWGEEGVSGDRMTSPLGHQSWPVGSGCA